MMGRAFAAVVLAGFVAPQAPAVAIDVRARSLQPGEFVLLTMTTPEPAGAVHVRAFDRDWPAFAVDGGVWRTALGIDLDVVPGRYDVAVRADGSAGVRRGTVTLEVRPKAFATRRLTVDDAFVNPPAAAQPRIEREAADLARLWLLSTGPARWTGPFIRPVPHEANSAFGTRSVFNGEPRNAHAGADFLSPAGTPVKAPAAGRVLLARELYYSGGTVMIDHGAGLISLFAHLSSIDVKPDAEIAAGARIGAVGATGRVTGAHLHWTTRIGGARVDPLSVMHVLAAPPGRDDLSHRH